MKIKFNSDEEFPLNKMVEIPTMTKVVSYFSWKWLILSFLRQIPL